MRQFIRQTLLTRQYSLFDKLPFKPIAALGARRSALYLWQESLSSCNNSANKVVALYRRSSIVVGRQR